MSKTKSNTETANIFGRTIPLTKNGGVNRTYLTKDEKEIYDAYVKKAKQEKRDLKTREIEAFFKSKK